MSDVENGPKVEFGMDKSNLIKHLRSLNIDGVLTAELNMGLDNITLSSEMTSCDVIKKMMR